MMVRDIMTRNVATCRPDTPLREAAEIMADNHIGCLVVKTDGKLAGIITDRDVLLAVADERNKNLNTLRVRDAMTDYVLSIRSASPVENAVRMMTENRVKKLPVVDEGRLVGIITASDIIWAQPKLIGELSKMMAKKE
jgi:CBS domain-containing protein